MTEQISPHWRSVMERLKAETGTQAAKALNSLLRQVVFSSDEETILSYETPDPLGASLYTSGGQGNTRLIHQYKNRCLFLSTGKCFCRCRYCFRRESSALDYGFASCADIDSLCSYLVDHTEVRELLVSGGDPLTGTDKQLETLFLAVRKCRHDILIRVCTRAPVFAPRRFTPQLIALLKTYKPLWLIPHINHSVEFSPQFAPEAYKVLSKLSDNGIPMQSQSVLLRGINDDVGTLVELFHSLTLIGIKPGYLFQGDLVPGTSHFRVPIDEGVRLYGQLRRELSGLSTPVYAVDIPGGGGKFNLLQLNPALMDIQVVRTGQAYLFKCLKGSLHTYPVEA